ncbi:MAG: tail protein X [Candidatus Nealsonbacteria bacterium]|nr:tail protein X [Candidatus Nealsonbacteria bacterium]
MDQSVKIAAAGFVLLCGIAAAMMFRHDGAQTGSLAGASGDELPLRRQTDPPLDRLLPPGPYLPPVASVERSQPVPNRTVTILTPMDPGAPPPTLGEDYPAPGVTDTSRWGTAIRPAFPSAVGKDTSQRLHRIVDGDTLQSLAVRYLGSEDRAMEIYEANREILSSPKVLPIGTVLKIPPQEPVARPSVDDVLQADPQ